MRGRLCAFIVLAMVGGVATAEDPALDRTRQLVEQGQHSEALQVVDRILSEAPDSAEALFLRGVILARAGRTSEAQQVFLDLTRRHPEHPEPFNNLAVLFAQSGDYERSVDVLKQALQTHSSYGTAYENLTKVYGKLASRAYDRALGQESGGASAGPALELLAALDGSLSTAPEIVRPPAVAERDAAPPVVRPSEPIASPAAEAPAPVVPAEPIIEFDAARVIATVEAWARAWSEQRADDYLAFYSRTFEPTDGSSRVQWSSERTARITGPRFIEVAVESVRVRQIDDRRAQARFDQSYRSDRFSDRVSKTLDLVWEAGGWKIRGEAAGDG